MVFHRTETTSHPLEFIDADTVHERLDYPTLVEGLKSAHLNQQSALNDLLISQPGSGSDPNQLFIRSAWESGGSLGTKIITIYPNNRNHTEKPPIQALFILFDGEDGSPHAVIDGQALTALKTAGDSALGTHFLAKQNISTLLMVGAGAMAPHLIRAHLSMRPSCQHIKIWNRTAKRAEILAEALQAEFPSVEPVDDLATAVSSADLISCATMAETPLIRGEWLSPGTHLDLVGAYRPNMREADDEAVRRGTLHVDSRETTLGEVGELIIPIKNGVLSESDIVADHYQRCRGEHPGRLSESEITLFKNGGGGHLDLMTAKILMGQLNKNRRPPIS